MLSGSWRKKSKPKEKTKMETTLGITDKNVEEMAERGWLSYSSKTGITVLEPGKKKAIETMQQILDHEAEGASIDLVESSALSITQLYLSEIDAELKLLGASE
jgi:hypothetical protein